MTGVSGQGKPPGRGLAVNLFVSLRADQWTKNLIVFAGLVFGERGSWPGIGHIWNFLRFVERHVSHQRSL